MFFESLVPGLKPVCEKGYLPEKQPEGDLDPVVSW